MASEQRHEDDGGAPAALEAAPEAAADAADKLLSEYERQAADVKARAEVWQRHLEDYNDLKGTLESISDRVVHSSTMIPMGKKAYMEGTLVHTNEIMVLLGDNWFAERSAKQAAEVAQRRIDKCSEMLEGLDKELTLIEGWKGSATATTVNDEGVDIREPYDEATEAEWARQHRERVSQAKKAEAATTADGLTDEELFRRLDELELEEELDEHIAREKEKKMREKASPPEETVLEQAAADPPQDQEKEDQVESQDDDRQEEEDWSESPPLTDDDEDEADGVDDDEGDQVQPDQGDDDQYKTVPDVSRRVTTTGTSPRQSRFSVTEIISEKEVLTLNSSNSSSTLNTAVSHQLLPTSSSDVIDPSDSGNEKSRRDHLAQVKPRKRRVSFGSISERLFLKDETTTAAGQPSQTPPTEDVYATVTGAATANPPADASPPIDVPTIFFSHYSESEGGAVGGGAFGASRIPHDPSDFVRLYGAGSPTRLKSILKPSGSSHSLSSFDEAASAAAGSTTLAGRFAVSPTKSISSLDMPSPGSSCGRFSISPMSVSSLDTSANSRFTVSPASVQADSPRQAQAEEQAGSSSPQLPAAQQPQLGDHPVRDVVVENSDPQPPPPPPEGARKQSRFKLSRVQI